MAKKTTGRNTPTVARSIAAPKTAKPLDPKEQPKPAVKTNPIKVRATQVGYYDHARRREGDVFIIANEQAFSARWMERVDPRTRERLTTAPQALQQKHDEILGGKVNAVRAEDDVFGDD